MTNFDVNLDSCVRKTINLGKLCAKFHKGEHCDECAASDKLYQEAKQSKDEEKLEDAKTLYARSKVFVNAVNVKDEDPTFPVYIYIFPPRVYDDLMGMMRGQRQLDPKFNAFHPITGRNILMTRKGTGKLTRYTPMLDTSVTPICNTTLLEKLKNGNFEDLHDLSRVEEFIDSGYAHMRQFETGTNIIRLLPPFDGQTVYKELKFHRFTVSQYNSYKNKSNEPTEPQTNNTPIEVGSNTKSDPFDPFDLPASATERSASPQVHMEAKEVAPVVEETATVAVEGAENVTADTDILNQIEELTKAQ